MGVHSDKNGVYVPAGRKHNGKDLFKIEGNAKGWVLRFTSKGFWMVTEAAGVEANDGRGFISSNEKGLDHPSFAVGWQVQGQSGYFSAWESQPSVTCVVRL